MHINCQLNLSRSSAVYYTGEHISGSLTLTVSKKPLQLEAISIKLLGISTTSWHETEPNNFTQIEHNDSTSPNEPLPISYGATKIHIQESQQLEKSLILPIGCTQLGNFEFRLPDGLPGSCCLPHGSVNYMLQVSLERCKKLAKCFQHRLIIRNCIKLLELRPAASESSTLRLSLKRSVGVPGQRIGYQLEFILPQTNCQFTTRLCQCVSYESQKPLAKFKKVVRVLDESSELSAALHLPLTVPIMSQMPGEPIQIAYYLETLSNCSESLRLPLFVGTVAPPPPIEETCPSLGCINFALAENDFGSTTINQLLPHSCAKETHGFHLTKYSEHLKLVRRQKKHSYVRLALRYFYKTLSRAN